MGMQKLDYIRRAPWISDINRVIDAVNALIDKVNATVEIEEVVIEREVKDFKFFNWEEVTLPYHAQHTLGKVEDATKVFAKYTLSYKEMKHINDLIIQGKIVSLVVNVTEEVTEKEKKQEAIFETIPTEIVTPPKKKKGRKKKTSWN